MPRFNFPVGGGTLAANEQSSSTKENTQDNYILQSLNDLNEDKQRLEGLIGVTPDAETDVATINYTSNNIIQDNKSLKENLEAIDAAALTTGDVVSTSPNNLVGTISIANGSLTFTVDTGTDVVTFSGSHGFTTAQAIRLESTTTLPGGISAAVTYYVGNLTSTTCKLYTTAAAATAGTTGAVDITSSGTGTHSINGTFVAGSGTSFSTVLASGDYIYINGATIKTYRVSTVESDTALLLYTETTQTLQGQTVKRLDSIDVPLIFEVPPYLLADGTENEHPIRLSQLNSSIGSAIKRLITGPVPYYNDAASLILPAGFAAYDSTGVTLMTIASNQTVSLATSGANGLDTGAEASNTWYYVYLIGDSTGVNTPKGLLSVTNEAVTGSVTLPSGYNRKRQLPLAIRNDGSSNQIRWIMVGRDNNSPLILYQTAMSVHAGGATTAGTTNVLAAGTSGTFANISCTSFIPPISRVGVFQALATFANACYTGLRTDANLPEYMGGGPAGAATWHIIPTTSGQVIDYKRAAGTGSVSVDVVGFYVTEVN